MKIVKSLIWLGFTALLLVSIPKIAWVFRSFEGSQALPFRVAGTQVDLLWLIPLFVAVCIDALTLALTYAMSIDKAKPSQVSMWAFVALLCGLSYYCNLLYNYAHAPAGSVWTDTFVSFATPLIVSGVPLFALCYTLILSRIEGKGETLEEKATRLEQEKKAKGRIQAARQGAITGPIKGMISGVSDLAKHTASAFGKTEYHPAQDGRTADDSASVSEGTNTTKTEEETPQETREPQTDKISAILAENATPCTTDDGVQSLVDTPAPDMPSIRSTGKLSITIKEAATHLKLSESYVRELRNKGVLRSPSRNKKLLTIKSIDEYADAHQKPSQNERYTDVLSAVEATSFGSENDAA